MVDWVTLGAKLAPTLIGGLFGDKNASRNETTKYNVQNFREMTDLFLHQNRFVHTRQAAKAAGLNFLTAVNAGGATPYSYGGVHPSAPSGSRAPLSSPAAIAGLVQGAIEGLSTTDQEESTRKKAKKQLEKIEKETKEAGGAAGVVDETEETLGEPSGLSMSEIRPISRNNGMGLFSHGMMPVVDLTGEVISIPKKTGERLNLKAGDALMAEDYEAVFGEQTGQVISLPKTARLAQDVIGQGTVEERIHKQENKWNMGGLFGIQQDIEKNKPKNFKPR